MRFAGFSVSRSILEMPTFHEPCSPLHQGEEQPDTELFLQAVPFFITLLVGVVGVEDGRRRGRERPGETAQYQAAPRSDEVDCKVHETLASQEWIWTRRKPAKRITFTESTRGSLKNILYSIYIIKNHELNNKLS
ncbi:hypothetical protein ALC57_16783 [Trachymyrmex cornetzi]|uniref:Uncharacterized protein n=1 Tax=Trachymyrmex cornetzi TaxID=471704 RepID=A0A151IUL7_9HYME|nr:hypothetical protein ALC57_16783 [Trachymyrmex cornetzi]